MSILRGILIVLLLGWCPGVIAGDRSALWPDIPAATGTPHPEGNEYWRKNHMTLMRHDRNLTMREGDREIGASLKKCFDCHTVTDSSGAALTYTDDRHFCRSCHDFAAVKVDCFVCHRSTPDESDKVRAHAAARPEPVIREQEAASGEVEQ